MISARLTRTIQVSSVRLAEACGWLSTVNGDVVEAYLTGLPTPPSALEGRLESTASTARQQRLPGWVFVYLFSLCAVFLTIKLSPRIARFVANDRIEHLKTEQQRLIDEGRVLDIEEAELLRADRLQALRSYVNEHPDLRTLEVNGATIEVRNMTTEELINRLNDALERRH
jgi:hypothetical protein